MEQAWQGDRTCGTEDEPGHGRDLAYLVHLDGQADGGRKEGAGRLSWSVLCRRGPNIAYTSTARPRRIYQCVRPSRIGAKKLSLARP